MQTNAAEWVCAMDMFGVKGEEGNGDRRQVWGEKGLMIETESSVPPRVHWGFFLLTELRQRVGFS